VRETVVAALEAGGFTDAMGRRLPLGAAVVLMTSPAATRDLLDTGVVATCDLVIDTLAPLASGSDYVSRMLLAPLAARFATNGLRVTFDPDFATWVASQLSGEGEAALAYLDRVLAPALVASLPPGATRLTAQVSDGRPVLVPEVTTGDDR
jgi:hypothetical protein